MASSGPASPVTRPASPTTPESTSRPARSRGPPTVPSSAASSASGCSGAPTAEARSFSGQAKKQAKQKVKGLKRLSKRAERMVDRVIDAAEAALPHVEERSPTRRRRRSSIWPKFAKTPRREPGRHRPSRRSTWSRWPSTPPALMLKLQPRWPATVRLRWPTGPARRCADAVDQVRGRSPGAVPDSLTGL